MPPNDEGRPRTRGGPAAVTAVTLPRATPRILVELPTERHRQLLVELDGMAHVDAAGRRVAYAKQATLAARLGIGRRLLQELVADLRTPGRDPRHLKVPAAGRRLGLLRVEPSRRPAPTTPGRSWYGVNTYILLFAQGEARAMPFQSARTAAPVSAGQVKAHSDPRALHNENTLSLERKGEYLPVTTVEGPGLVVQDSYPQDRTQAADSDKMLKVLPLGEARRIVAAAASWGDVSAVEALALACRPPA